MARLTAPAARWMVGPLRRPRLARMLLAAALLELLGLLATQPLVVPVSQ